MARDASKVKNAWLIKDLGLCYALATSIKIDKVTHQWTIENR